EDRAGSSIRFPLIRYRRAIERHVVAASTDASHHALDRKRNRADRQVRVAQGAPRQTNQLPLLRERHNRDPPGGLPRPAFPFIVTQQIDIELGILGTELAEKGIALVASVSTDVRPQERLDRALEPPPAPHAAMIATPRARKLARGGRGVPAGGRMRPLLAP